MSFEARNALMLAKKVVDKAAEYKKVAQKAEGGEVKRKTNKVGLFSKAAEKARQLPSGSVPATQLISTLRNKGGIKAEELANAGITDSTGQNLTPEWQSKGKITPEDLAAHFEHEMPQIEETVLQRKGNSYPYRDADEWQSAIMRAERARNFDEAERLTAAWESQEGHGPSGTPKYEKYTLPGGENYREVLLKLKDKMPKGWKTNYIDLSNTPTASLYPKDNPPSWLKRYEVRDENDELVGRGPTEDEAFQDAQNRFGNKMQKFQSGHWDDPNVLAHIRMADRTGPNGEKILHVEEVQSDWGQKGKKEGFTGQNPLTNEEKDEFQRLNTLPKNVLKEDEAVRLSDLYKRLNTERYGIPSAPYVTSTSGWTDLALKRVLKEAAEGGYDKVVWTPGAEQAGRYDLSKSLSRIAYNPDSGYFQALDLNGKPAINQKIELSELPNLVGKETAEKLISQKPNNLGVHQLETEDLSVGGEGMKEYYDNILPKRLQAVAQKHDKTAQLGYHDVQQVGKLPGMDMTPQMRDSILKGQEAYARGGDVMHTRKVPKPHAPVVGEREHKSRHPAMMIPGIHVVGAIHGIPTFTGKK